MEACPTPALVAGAGQIVTVYLRDAQAYMLISMPTDTSTIFGVFQVIRVSQVTCKYSGATFAPGLNLGRARTWRKCGTTRPNARV